MTTDPFPTTTRPSHLSNLQTSNSVASPAPAPSSSVPITPSTPPTSFQPLDRTSGSNSPTRSPVLHRRKSSTPGPKLHRRASEHFEDRLGVLRGEPEGKGEVEVDIAMPKEEEFIEDIADHEVQAVGSPRIHAIHRTRSKSPLRPSPPSPPRPTAHHVAVTEPPKLFHGHSGLCSPPTTSPPVQGASAA